MAILTKNKKNYDDCGLQYDYSVDGFPGCWVKGICTIVTTVSNVLHWATHQI